MEKNAKNIKNYAILFDNFSTKHYNLTIFDNFR